MVSERAVSRYFSFGIRVDGRHPAVLGGIKLLLNRVDFNCSLRDQTRHGIF